MKKKYKLLVQDIDRAGIEKYLIKYPDYLSSIIQITRSFDENYDYRALPATELCIRAILDEILENNF